MFTSYVTSQNSDCEAAVPCTASADRRCPDITAGEVAYSFLTYTTYILTHTRSLFVNEVVGQVLLFDVLVHDACVVRLPFFIFS